MPLTAYLHASALLPMLIQKPGSAVVGAFMLSHREPLLVSEFAAAEVACAGSN